jgi:putative peptide zinc metalloprotease protein
MICETITITSYDKSRSVVSTDSGRNFLLNNESVTLISILKDAPDIGSALARFNNQFNSNLDTNQFETFIDEKLGNYGILRNSKHVASKKPLGYLPIKLQILNPKMVFVLSRPLTFMYKPKVFWTCAAVSITFLIVIFWANSQFISFHSTMAYKIAGLILFSLVVHELGHTTACVAADVRPGGIGVGLYYFLPVLYADITAIWSARRQLRIIANLGGIFSELIYSSVLAGFFLATSKSEYLASAFYLFAKLTIQMNPFIRLDGYWVLSDLTNTPNLSKKSNQMVADAIAFAKQIILFGRVLPPKFDCGRLLLLAFGILNWSFLCLFTFYTLKLYFHDIISFPETVLTTVQLLISSGFDSIDIKRKFILVLTFYFLLIRFSIQFIWRMSHGWLKRVSRRREI